MLNKIPNEAINLAVVAVLCFLVLMFILSVLGTVVMNRIYINLKKVIEILLEKYKKD